VTVLEIVCIVSGSAVDGALGRKAFERWLYIAMHDLVWVKWGIGNYIFHEKYLRSQEGI
jgi:hypothetical protein